MPSRRLLDQFAIKNTACALICRNKLIRSNHISFENQYIFFMKRKMKSNFYFKYFMLGKFSPWKNFQVLIEAIIFRSTKFLL